MNLKIQRIYQPDCTVGMFNFGDFRGFTLELPYLDNQQNISCIPSGTYICCKHVSKRLGNCISVKHVPNRDDILIHTGNYTSQIEGCILVGDSLRDINVDCVPDVTNSSKTLSALMGILPDAFLLEIK